MEIRQLERCDYRGKKFTVRYKTHGYYDVCAAEHGFLLKYTRFKKPIEKSFDAEFFGEWLENPVAFGAFENGEIIGYVEGSAESWNNRFRISNVVVFDNENRKRGVGTLLMNAIMKKAEESNVRMIVLETQSCNATAIAFYKSQGFEIIGFDLYSYSNDDPARHEVRIEMGKKIL